MTGRIARRVAMGCRRRVPRFAMAGIAVAVAASPARGQLLRRAAVETHRRGVAVAEQKRFDEAIAYFTRALRLDPGLAEAYRDRGLMYIHKNDPARAIADLNVAVRRKPRDATAYFNRAYAYDLLGDGALADCTQALALDDSNLEAYFTRGLADQARGNTDQALADWREGLRRQPDFLFLMTGGRPTDRADPVLAALTAALEKGKDEAREHKRRGDEHAANAEPDQALADYSEAIRLNRNYVAAYNNRAYIYYKKGDLAKALAEYDRALKIDPNNELLRKNRDLVAERLR